MLGLGLSIPQVAARGSRSLVAAIRSLFATNEPGVWYDPSDLSTLFQDTAGTTPVTAVGQPVGLMLDKSKGLVLGSELSSNVGGPYTATTGWTGNNLTPALTSGEIELTGTASGIIGGYFEINVTANVPVRIVIPVRSVSQSFSVNVYNGAFSSLITNAGVTVPAGTNSTVTFTVTPTLSFIRVYVFHNSGVVTSRSAFVSSLSVKQLPGNHAYQTTATSRPVLSARVNQYLATETLATQNVTTLATQYRLRFEGTGTITLHGTATGVYSAGSHLITCTAGTLTSTVSGSVTKADLRVANDGANLPPYQRVNTVTDYDADPAKFPHYLRFDGVDDWLVTNTITPGIDKAQVFAGVRRLTNASQGMILEASTNVAANSGSFWLVSGDSTYQYSAVFRGTALIGGSIDAKITSASFAPPSTIVITATSEIQADLIRISGNGVLQASATGDQGTGNFLAYPLYIGRRGGTSLPFNGHLYSLIVRFGSNLPIGAIEKTEKYINTKTGAY